MSKGGGGSIDSLWDTLARGTIAASSLGLLLFILDDNENDF